jgi:hypothetical protein
VALSANYKKRENQRRRSLLRRLISGDSQFIRLLIASTPESQDNRQVSEHFGVGKTCDRSNMHRQNLRGIRLRKSKLSAADIAWIVEDALDGAEPADLGSKLLTKDELSAFLRMTTLLYTLLEIYP